MLDKLFTQFLREKQYLENLSPKTIKYYRWVFNRWSDHINEMPDKMNIKEFVISLNQSNLLPFTVNSYIRGMNCFLSWLYENEQTAEHLKIKKIKTGTRGIKTYSDTDLKKILAFHPKTFTDHRLYAMICLMLDCGVRIDECLTLKRESVDLDNLLIKVIGKGDKERLIPIGIECRKYLYKFLKRHESEVVFPSRDGTKIEYKTALDQLKLVSSPMHVSFHKFRHTFASCYVRDGGNVFFLQRILGHSDLQTTKIYIESSIEDLQLTHMKISLLNRLK